MDATSDPHASTMFATELILPGVVIHDSRVIR